MFEVDFGPTAISKTRINKWYKHSQNNREDADDEKSPEYSRTPTTDKNVEKVKKKRLWT